MFKKGGFPFTILTPTPSPYSMLEYNRTVTRTSTLVLVNVVPRKGGGGGEKAIRKRVSLPNTFDDDCELKL